MRVPARRVPLWVLTLDVACLIAAAGFLLATPGTAEAVGGSFAVGQTLILVLTALAFSVVGALIAVRRPENRVGALCLAIGSVWALGFVVGGAGYWMLATDRPESVALWMAWFGDEVWVPALGMMAIHLPLRLPDGRLPSPRWCVFSRVCTAAIVLAFAVVATSPDADWDGHANPAGTDALQPLTPLLLVLAVGLVGAVASVVSRYRRSADGRERLQLRCVALGAGIFIGAYLVALVASLAFGLEDGSVAADVLQGAALLTYSAIPLSIGMAILRHRLYDIDRVINRTLVYAALSALLAGTYFALVLLLGRALDPVVEGSGLAVAVSTLAVAALFQPVRRRLQAVVDRRFYRHKYDAARTLEGFSARLQSQTDLDALRADLAEVVRQAMQPAHVSVWLRGGAR